MQKGMESLENTPISISLDQICPRGKNVSMSQYFMLQLCYKRKRNN